MEKTVIEQMIALNVNGHTEDKNGLTYLSWAWAWAETLKVCPDADYEIKKYDGKPYFYDESLGYMVTTSVTINGKTREMWLPVMDASNVAMKNYEYEYESMQWKDGKKELVIKKCKAASMMDINKTIMRCLVKNLAMFGLGLYIYAGEDLPETEEDSKKEEPKKSDSKKEVKREESQKTPNEIINGVSPLITDLMLKTLVEKMELKKVTKEQILTRYRKDKLENLTIADYKKAMTCLEMSGKKG